MVAIDFSGTNGFIFGVGNHRSLAWAIAQQLGQAGARLAFAYQSERLREGVEKLASTIPGSILVECDVTDDAAIERAFGVVKAEFGSLSYLVHSVAYARKDDLEGLFRDTSREGYRTALEISAYSLLPMMHLAAPLMEEKGGSVVALSYLASQRVIPNYNVMGSAKAVLEQATRQLAYELGPKNIRVNALSAGPVNTLAARGIRGFTDLLKEHSGAAPLERNITKEEVGTAGLFLLSDLSSGITGTTLYVDAGWHILGM